MNLKLSGKRVLIHVDVLSAYRTPVPSTSSQTKPSSASAFLQASDRLLRHPEPVQTLISMSISAKKYQIKENQRNKACNVQKWMAEKKKKEVET